MGGRSMEHYLVVANQTLREPRLRAVVDRLAEQHRCSFDLRVPATPPTEEERDLLYGPRIMGRLGEEPGVTLARHALQDALESWASSGLEVTGQVADPDPARAIRSAMAEQAYDMLILSTLARGTSRWLAADLPHRMRRELDLPVLHVESGRLVEDPKPRLLRALR
jgi:nucleotide-binding universal stress UspA family protein